MKKIYLSAVMLLVMMIGNAQDRVNATLPDVSETVKGILTQATGWTKDAAGQWKSTPNELGSGVNDNFSSLELRDVKIADSTYSILIKKFTRWYYEYPSIKEGWTSSPSVSYYVFSSKGLEGLKNLEEGKTTSKALYLLYGELVMPISAKDPSLIEEIEKDLGKKLKESKSKYINYALILKILPYKENIRFTMSRTLYSEPSELKPILATDLGDSYYETPKETFVKLFQL